MHLVADFKARAVHFSNIINTLPVACDCCMLLHSIDVVFPQGCVNMTQYNLDLKPLSMQWLINVCGAPLLLTLEFMPVLSCFKHSSRAPATH